MDGTIGISLRINMEKKRASLQLYARKIEIYRQ